MNPTGDKPTLRARTSARQELGKIIALIFPPSPPRAPMALRSGTSTASPAPTSSNNKRPAEEEPATARRGRSATSTATQAPTKQQKGKSKANTTEPLRSIGLGAPLTTVHVWVESNGLDDDEEPDPVTDTFHPSPSIHTSSAHPSPSYSFSENLPPFTSSSSARNPSSSSANHSSREDDPERLARKAAKKLRKKADKKEQKRLAADQHDMEQRVRTPLTLAPSPPSHPIPLHDSISSLVLFVTDPCVLSLSLLLLSQNSDRLAAEREALEVQDQQAAARRTVPSTHIPPKSRAARRDATPLEKLIKSAGKQTAYMKACWITGQQHRVLFHSECLEGADHEWIPETPESDKHDSLEWTRELKVYVSDLLRTVPSDYPPDDIQKLFTLGMTMARAEMRTRVDSAFPRLFPDIPLLELSNRKSDAVARLQGDSGLDFASKHPDAIRASGREFLEAHCLVEMGSALVWGLESVGCDSPVDRRHGKPPTTKAIQWNLKQATPSFIALCVLCIRWKLSGVANFQAESQTLKFAKLYRWIRDSLIVTDDTPAPTRSRVAKVMHLWTTSLFERTEDEEVDDEDGFRRPDIDFANDFADEFGSDGEEAEGEEAQESAGDAF
ncbi:hypothetical protein P7C70_g5080, partial [Phenoliferia sp. Uapishka_3]